MRLIIFALGFICGMAALFISLGVALLAGPLLRQRAHEQFRPMDDDQSVS